jgi:hypothetical protein
MTDPASSGRATVEDVKAALRAIYGNESDGMLARYQGSVLNDWRLTDAVAQAIHDAIQRERARTCAWRWDEEEYTWIACDGSGHGEEFSTGEADELYPHCCICGGKLVVETKEGA